jgi:hypothetical protein
MITVSGGADAGPEAQVRFKGCGPLENTAMWAEFFDETSVFVKCWEGTTV